MAPRTCLAGLLIAAAAGCGTTARDDAQEQVLECLEASGWSEASRPQPNVVILHATDRHASVELSFWRNAAAARNAVPDLAPIGVGWQRNVSFRSGLGFTYADEQTVDRCASSSPPAR
jgi:hypothetical protein